MMTLLLVASRFLLMLLGITFFLFALKNAYECAQEGEFDKVRNNGKLGLVALLIFSLGALL